MRTPQHGRQVRVLLAVQHVLVLGLGFRGVKQPLRLRARQPALYWDSIDFNDVAVTYSNPLLVSMGRCIECG